MVAGGLILTPPPYGESGLHRLVDAASRDDVSGGPVDNLALDDVEVDLAFALVFGKFPCGIGVLNRNVGRGATLGPVLAREHVEGLSDVGRVERQNPIGSSVLLHRSCTPLIHVHFSTALARLP